MTMALEKMDYAAAREYVCMVAEQVGNSPAEDFYDLDALTERVCITHGDGTFTPTGTGHDFSVLLTLCRYPQIIVTADGAVAIAAHDVAVLDHDLGDLHTAGAVNDDNLMRALHIRGWDIRACVGHAPRRYTLKPYLSL